MLDTEIRERMAKYSFYHTIRLTDGLATPGWPAVVPIVNLTLRSLRSLDLKGKRVLDIGCRDGLFCFEAEKLGASEVIGIDNDPSIGAREFLIPFFGSKVKLVELNLMELTPQTFGKFDVIVFPGVLYHLRYPFQALKLICDVLNEGGQLVLETAVFLDRGRRPLLFCPIGGESPYEPTSCTFFNTRGLKDTLGSFGLTVQRTEYANGGTGPGYVTRLKSIGKELLRIPVPPFIDRVTMVCRKTPEIIDVGVKSYWDGTHRMHTEHQGTINAQYAEQHRHEGLLQSEESGFVGGLLSRLLKMKRRQTRVPGPRADV
jgi:SAM-dependent methyltransferase